MASPLSTTTLFNSTNLIAYYKQDTGALTTDSKNSNTLTNNNSVADGTGIFGGASDFSNANTNKSLSIANALIGNGNRSLSGWFKVQTAPTSTNLAVFMHAEEATTHSFVNITYFNDAGTLKLQALKGFRTGAETTASYTTTLTTGVWYNIVMTWDGTNVKLYLDNVLVATQANAGGSGSGASNSCGIGAFTSAAIRFASIFADDCAFWNTGLTVSDVNIIFNGSPSGLLTLDMI